MASRSKTKTTMAKLSRERALRERREIKQAKKEARRRAAAEPPPPAPEADADEGALEEPEDAYKAG